MTEPCTCTVACVPQGITEDQHCRMAFECDRCGDGDALRTSEECAYCGCGRDEETRS